MIHRDMKPDDVPAGPLAVGGKHSHVWEIRATARDWAGEVADRIPKGYWDRADAFIARARTEAPAESDVDVEDIL